jgi:hypothetical protein
MKERFKLLVKDKHFWLSLVMGFVGVSFGLFYPLDDNFNGGQVSGMTIGLGISLLIISVFEIKEAIIPNNNKKDGK